MAKAKQLKLKGYKGWNVVLAIIFFLYMVMAVVEGVMAYLSSKASTDPSNMANTVMYVMLATGSLSLVIFLTIVITLARIGKKKKKI